LPFRDIDNPQGDERNVRGIPKNGPFLSSADPHLEQGMTFLDIVECLSEGFGCEGALDLCNGKTIMGSRMPCKPHSLFHGTQRAFQHAH
jgi:hypothetical protein